jgi:iron complex transport system ATP-binding protein
MNTQLEAPLLEIRNAAVFRGSTRVLSDFNLIIPRRQNVAILGPNGAGKTTLLKLLTRELYPVASADSRVRILGQERWNVRELRQQLGMVSHDLQVDYAGSVPGRDVVLSGFAASEGTRHVSYPFSSQEIAAARATMATLGISGLANKPYGQMSTGEQRRCLLGRALVTEPHTLVLDEPLNGLDLAAAFDGLRIMTTLMDQSVSLILVTHHVGEIPPGIERIVLLKQGRIIADGPKAETLTEANLSNLYGTSIRLTEANGYFSAVPG